MKKFLHELEDNFCAAVLLIMTILTFVNVIARYLFKASMPFIEELTCLGLVILSILGAAVAAKRGAHLGLSVITDLLPQKVQKWFGVLANIFGIILGIVILYYGFWMAQKEYVLKQLTPGMQWPEWLFGMFLPIGGGVLTIRYLLLTIKSVKNTKQEEV